MNYVNVLVLIGSIAPSMASAASFGSSSFGGRSSTTTGGGVAQIDTATSCLTGEVNFDGNCLDSNNVDSLLGLSAGEVVAFQACVDDDDVEIEDCVVVQIDEEGLLEGYYDYVVEATACTSSYSWSGSAMMCLGDYQTVYRANHALDTWEYLHLIEYTDEITHQTVGTQRGWAVWVDDSRSVVEFESSQGASSSEGVDFMMTLRNETMDGELIEEDSFYGSIIAENTGLERTSAERCEAMKNTKDNIFNAGGDGFKGLCSAGFFIKSISYQDFKAELSFIDTCDLLGEGMKSFGGVYTDWVEGRCLENPGAFFPESFTMMSYLGELGLFSLVPLQAIEGECDDLDGQTVNVQYERTDDAGDTETCTVKAELSCEESGGDCACSGTPVEEPTCG